MLCVKVNNKYEVSGFFHPHVICPVLAVWIRSVSISSYFTMKKDRPVLILLKFIKWALSNSRSLSLKTSKVRMFNSSLLEQTDQYGQEFLNNSFSDSKPLDCQDLAISNQQPVGKSSHANDQLAYIIGSFGGQLETSSTVCEICESREISFHT